MIEVGTFWKSNRMLISRKELESYLNHVNYPLEKDEIEILMEVLANNEGMVTI